MSARSGSIGEKKLLPRLGPFQASFSMDRKHAKEEEEEEEEEEETYFFLPILLGGPIPEVLWNQHLR